MQVTPARVTSVASLQSALQRAHRNRIRGLTLTEADGGVQLTGVADNYYGVQLLVRDVLAAGVQVRWNRIRVRPEREPQIARRSPPRQILIGSADHRTAFLVAELLRAEGDEVEVVPDGVTTVAVVARRPPDLLALLGPLPWGGADGVIELLAESGWLSRLTVYYAGPECGLGGLSDDLRRRLAGVRFTSDLRPDGLVEMFRVDPETQGDGA